MPEEMRRYIGNCSFVCIDYFDHLLNRPDPMKEVCSMLNVFLSEGGKIILQSSKSIDANGILRYLRARKLVQVTSDFPSFETLKKISLQHVDAAVVEDLAETLFAKSENSVRVVLGQMIAEDARRKLRVLHDRIV
jgi:chromosomal replication initiation ATPase DnaA